ncbi:MAG: type IV toxin-antitoxin system AbiEi family antitoxin domain-containing protein [Nitrososphaera sp.]
MCTQKLTLGANELRLLFTLENRGRIAFSTNDAKEVLGTSDASVWNVIYRLKKKKRIEEIERGKYLLIPARAGYEGLWSEVSYLILPSILSEYYVAFYSALNYWGMTEQVPAIVFVATTKRKRVLEYGPNIFRFVRLSERKFFGFEEAEIAGARFKVSSREKTLLDCLMYPKYCGGLDEVVKGIWEAKDELDFDKLLDYAKKLKVSAVSRRLGYVLSLLNIEKETSDKVTSGKLKGFMWLDPLGPKKVIEYSRKYGLIINRSEKELKQWMGH